MQDRWCWNTSCLFIILRQSLGLHLLSAPTCTENAGIFQLLYWNWRAYCLLFKNKMLLKWCEGKIKGNCNDCFASPKYRHLEAPQDSGLYGTLVEDRLKDTTVHAFQSLEGRRETYRHTWQTLTAKDICVTSEGIQYACAKLCKAIPHFIVLWEDLMRVLQCVRRYWEHCLPDNIRDMTHVDSDHAACLALCGALFARTDPFGLACAIVSSFKNFWGLGQMRTSEQSVCIAWNPSEW